MSSGTLAVGTLVYVADALGRWGGYALLPDGTVARIEASIGEGLAKDVDFTSSCRGRVKEYGAGKYALSRTATPTPRSRRSPA